MLDLGWQELLVIGALALIVVGPKDLPGLLRTCGQWVGKIRGMAREFQRSMNEAARETDMANFKELRDLKNDISSNLDFKAQASKAQSFLDGSGDDPKAKPGAADGDTDAPKTPVEAQTTAPDTTVETSTETSAETPAKTTTEPDAKATGT